MTDTPRRPEKPIFEDIRAGNKFRGAMVEHANRLEHGMPMWCGWAIMDAFLAGAAHGRANPAVRAEGSYKICSVCGWGIEEDGDFPTVDNKPRCQSCFFGDSDRPKWGGVRPYNPKEER